MGGVSVAERIKTTRPAIPQIYAYTTPEIARHSGWTKIGYTERDVRERIEEQTHTAGVAWNLEWNGNATYEDGSGTFRDTDFHGYLRKLDYADEPDTEWFEITGTESKGRFYEFRENKGVLEDTEPTIDYVLRAEQARAVDQAADYSQLHEVGEFLWNAKPRFGKTLATYDLCKRLGALRVLIVTNRPAIANSWYDDYVKFVGTRGGYYFVSHADALKGKPYCISRMAYVKAISQDANGPKGCIEFVSLQDLKGAIYFGGTIDKLSEVADIEWDVLVIDEAHEGVDTFKTDVAFDHIRRKFTLHLSGTPFKAIANEKFQEDAIYNWTYADEQAAKAEWEESELPNPYADLPQLNMFTYQMSEIVEAKLADGVEIDGQNVDFAWDLNEFFATTAGGYFVHNAEVDRFLDALTTQEKFPFSTPALRDELRHTFWLLNRVDSAKALVRKLRQHPVFGQYEIVLAAGDGKLDEGDAADAALDRVRAAIAAHERTITISVGQLTTGVTVPEWTGVLMLSNMKSPALYMQAAFRAQNPCLFSRGGEFLRKENAYVFDFDPARTLTIYEQFANDLYADTAQGAGTVDAHKQRIRRLLNFFPVIGEDDAGQMVELDAERVLSIPRRIRSREVVRRGFMSDFLFQNISGVFRAPAEVLELIQKFEPYKAPSKDLGIDEHTADELSLNDQGEVELPEQLVVGLAADVFGEKIYDAGEDVRGYVEELLNTPVEPSAEEQLFAELHKRFVDDGAQPIFDVAKESFGPEMSKAQQTRMERRIKADREIRFNRDVGEYHIQKNLIERDRAAALERVHTQESADEVDREHDERLAAAQKDLAERLVASRDELAHDAGTYIVREVKTAKNEATKQTIEAGVKDHLRGFARTIPSFLMAYGDENLTLANFDDYTEDDVFEEVTGISEEWFRKLRDGFEYTDEATGETRRFEGGLFDPVVFNDSVQEFLRLRNELANYFDESLEHDIFDYIPPQKTNQIFTPRAVVVQMVDALEEENPGCFDDPDATFADLYMKSGLYITEIVKRLFASAGLKRAFPDEGERIRHILTMQVYGVAPTRIIYLIATNYIFGFDEGLRSRAFAEELPNFACADTAAAAKDGVLAELVDELFG